MLERQHLWRRCWREDLSLAASPQPHLGPERPQPLVPSQPSWDWSLQPYLTACPAWNPTPVTTGPSLWLQVAPLASLLRLGVGSPRNRKGAWALHSEGAPCSISVSLTGGVQSPRTFLLGLQCCPGEEGRQGARKQEQSDH